MRLPLSFRFAARELRSGVRGFRIFLACLALGVAAIAAAGSTAEAFRVGLASQAAEVLAASDVPADWDRALGLTTEILARAPAHASARRIEQRIHESAGRWGLVDRGIVARIEAAKAVDTKAGLLLLRAEILRFRLRDPVQALGALRDAFALTPGDEELRRAIVSALEIAALAKPPFSIVPTSITAVPLSC